jgi:hypothetical protein
MKPQTTLTTFDQKPGKANLSQLEQNFLGCYDCAGPRGNSCAELKEGCVILLAGLEKEPF